MINNKRYKLLWYIEDGKAHYIIFDNKEQMIEFIKQENLDLAHLQQTDVEDNK